MPELLTDGFTVALNEGFLPVGNPGEMAHLYFDASGDDVRINVFGYNGNDDVTSHLDGSPADGVQDPDRIVSSLVDDSFVLWTTSIDEADGTRTLGFSIDVSAINAHMPLYPGDGPYTGIQFGADIGVWFHPLAGSATAYEDGWLTGDTVFGAQGWFDTIESAEPVPEPLARAPPRAPQCACPAWGSTTDSAPGAAGIPSSCT